MIPWLNYTSHMESIPNFFTLYNSRYPGVYTRGSRIILYGIKNKLPCKLNLYI